MSTRTRRPYEQSRRRVQAGLTRVVVLQAARELLLRAGGHAFTLDAVARAAGVSRATVFNLFGGKPGLLHALFDELSGDAGLMDVDALLTQPDAGAALADYVRAFAAFYEGERALLRRLRAHAALDAGLDAEFGAFMRARDAKRVAGLLYLVQRLAGLEPGAAPAWPTHERTAARLAALLSFEVFESLAGPDRPLTDAVADVLAMARCIATAPV